MKRRTITISNIAIQFDADRTTSGSPMEQAAEIMDAINRELIETFQDAQPQIMASATYKVKVNRHSD